MADDALSAYGRAYRSGLATLTAPPSMSFQELASLALDPNVNPDTLAELARLEIAQRLCVLELLASRPALSEDLRSALVARCLPLEP